MKQAVFILLCFMGLLFSCKKESHNQFSHWYIGSDSFASNNVIVRTDYTGTDLICNDIKNSFAFGFANNFHLPDNGILILTDSISSNYGITNQVTYGFHYNGNFYRVSKSANGYLIASAVNGKASYKLDSTWLINYNNPNDSVIIHGIFNEP